MSPLCLKIIPCIRKMYKTPLFRSSALFKILQSFHTFIEVSALTRDLNGVFYFFI